MRVPGPYKNLRERYAYLMLPHKDLWARDHLALPSSSHARKFVRRRIWIVVLTLFLMITDIPGTAFVGGLLMWRHDRKIRHQGRENTQHGYYSDYWNPELASRLSVVSFAFVGVVSALWWCVCQWVDRMGWVDWYISPAWNHWLLVLTALAAFRIWNEWGELQEENAFNSARRWLFRGSPANAAAALRPYFEGPRMVCDRNVNEVYGFLRAFEAVGHPFAETIDTWKLEHFGPPDPYVGTLSYSRNLAQEVKRLGEFQAPIAGPGPSRATSPQPGAPQPARPFDPIRELQFRMQLDFIQAQSQFMHDLSQGRNVPAPTPPPS